MPGEGTSFYETIRHAVKSRPSEWEKGAQRSFSCTFIQLSPHDYTAEGKMLLHSKVNSGIDRVAPERLLHASPDCIFISDEEARKYAKENHIIK